MTVWTLEMRNLAGTPVVTNCLAESPECTFGFALNGIGTISWRLPINGTGVNQTNYLPGQRTLHLKKDGTIVWAGFLLAGEADPDWVTFSGKTWEFAMTNAVVSANERYNGVDQLDIAWDLVTTYVTTGATGITRASATLSGKNRKRTWCCDDMTPVFDAITDLAGTRFGFDWWLTPAKVWTTAYQYRGTNRTATVIIDDKTNFTQTKYEYDAEGVEDRLWFVPHNVGTCSDISYRDFNDTPATWRREGGIDLSEVNDSADRIDIVYETLRNNQPRIQIGGTINAQGTSGLDFGDFDLGDSVHVNLSRGWMTTNANFKVLDYKVLLKQDCVEQMDVTLDNVTTV